MDGLKGEMDGLNGDMNGLKEEMEGLTKLLQEMFPNGEKVFHETHAENKRNINHDFRD